MKRCNVPVAMLMGLSRHQAVVLHAAYSSMPLRARKDFATGSFTSQQVSGALLLLVVIAATASAQQPPDSQFTSLSLPRIDWVALAADAGASGDASTTSVPL